VGGEDRGGKRGCVSGRQRNYRILGETRDPEPSFPRFACLSSGRGSGSLLGAGPSWRGAGGRPGRLKRTLHPSFSLSISADRFGQGMGKVGLSCTTADHVDKGVVSSPCPPSVVFSGQVSWGFLLSLLPWLSLSSWRLWVGHCSVQNARSLRARLLVFDLPSRSLLVLRPGSLEQIYVPRRRNGSQRRPRQGDSVFDMVAGGRLARILAAASLLQV